jgi:hypothetical protein
MEEEVQQKQEVSKKIDTAGNCHGWKIDDSLFSLK